MNVKFRFSWAGLLFCLAAYFQLDVVDAASGTASELAAYLLLGGYIAMAVALFTDMHNIVPVLGVGAGVVSSVLSLIALAEVFDDLGWWANFLPEGFETSMYIAQIFVILALAFVLVNVLAANPKCPTFLVNWDTDRGVKLWFLPMVLMIVGAFIPVINLMGEMDLEEAFEMLGNLSGGDGETIEFILNLASQTLSWSLACKYFSNSANRPSSNNGYGQGGYQQPYQQNNYQQQNYQQQNQSNNPYQG